METSNPKDSRKNLNGLLGTSPAAKQYFNSLPEYVQEMIVERRQNIKSEGELHRAADHLTQGDR